MRLVLTAATLLAIGVAAKADDKPKLDDAAIRKLCLDPEARKLVPCKQEKGQYTDKVLPKKFLGKVMEMSAEDFEKEMLLIMTKEELARREKAIKTGHGCSLLEATQIFAVRQQTLFTPDLQMYDLIASSKGDDRERLLRWIHFANPEPPSTLPIPDAKK